MYAAGRNMKTRLSYHRSGGGCSGGGGTAMNGCTSFVFASWRSNCRRPGARCSAIQCCAQRTMRTTADAAGVFKRCEGVKNAETFLKEYWQRRPLLIRGAFSHFKSPLSANELAGLALEQDVESRIVVEKNRREERATADDWELKWGPFEEKVFSELPEHGYTLLVNEVNRHVPAVQDLLEHFRFVPNYRIDDVMVSYAAQYGGIGPHIDNYDVFLLQASGTRRWRVGESRIEVEDEQVVPDCCVRVLQNAFVPDYDWTLYPGDMLYIPPRIPHWGTAMHDDQCMTFSIGFRAPKIKDLVLGFAESVAENKVRDDVFLEDSIEDLVASAKANNPGLISNAAIAAARDAALKVLNDPHVFREWFCSAVTDSKRFRSGDEFAPYISSESEAESLLSELLSSHSQHLHVELTEACTFAYCEETTPEGNPILALFVNGDPPERVDATSLRFVQLLCSRTCRPIHPTTVRKLFRDDRNPQRMRELVVHLMTRGYLSIVDSRKDD
ncbi:50S ribosomal protein L16 3-hydroxylase [Porphyridium purpureum]|uniref:Bifunctional lysine-specific demethylase and histidyl-hydroxylase n=1 Tax=Porphyridium purpureum TaxID=35688 RepID=A0A5J4YVP9_PORPP|nr:50S ribosomal protein L16 3-hydroxylase [Porphyridium purpureum]|eukprot:POR5649..scf227_4